MQSNLTNAENPRWKNIYLCTFLKIRCFCTKFTDTIMFLKVEKEKIFILGNYVPVNWIVFSVWIVTCEILLH